MSLARAHRQCSLTLLFAVVACGGGSDSPAGVVTEPPSQPPPVPTVVDLAVLGRGTQTTRYNAEVWVRGTVAYTSSWGQRAAIGNAVYTWDVSGAVPRLVDSAIVTPGATTLGDVQASDDGKLLIVPTEAAPGSIVVFDLSDPFKPTLIARFFSPKITRGVHTCEVQRVNGKLYAFLALNPSSSSPAQLMIVDLSVPTAPTEVVTMAMGRPYLHDVFVRDGLLFTALWDDGLSIYDIGGGQRGGSVANPVFIGNVQTRGGAVHNVWWFHDGVGGSKRFAIVGEEQPTTTLNSSSGDIHIVDLTNMAAPTEVAFFHVVGAGTHNFSVDEAQGILYAAYYNAGVQVLDVRGDLSTCVAAARASDGRCDLQKSGRLLGRAFLDQGTAVYVWGVHAIGGSLYASDMLNGIWKARMLTR